jgi:hypothetical protein
MMPSPALLRSSLLAFDGEVTREWPRRAPSMNAAEDFEETRELRRFDPTDFERTRELPRATPSSATPPSVREDWIAFVVRMRRRHFSWNPRFGAPVVFYFVAVTAFAMAMGFLFGTHAHP